MSKDITDRYQLIGSVARGELPRDEDIQHFAESTMNELLAWYGYGDKVIRHVDPSSGSGCSGPQPPPGRDDAEPQTPPPPPPPAVRSKSRFLCSVTDASSSLDAHPPDLLSAGGQPVYESDRAGVGLLQKRSPPQSSSSGSSQRPSRDLHQFTRDAASSSQSLDSTQSLLRNNSCRPDSVNSLTSTDSTESNHIASTKVPTREAADYSQNHQRHPAAMTKLKKVCDWCRQVPASISLTDAVDGLNQLSFCSELCLNHYKMNLFCTETQQYLQQIQNSEEAGDLTVAAAAAAAADNKILITPDLWMAEKREGKRARFNENQMEIRASDDNCYNRAAAADDSADQDDELCRRGSDCGSTVDTSNGMEFAEYLDLKKSKRKKDDRAAVLSSEISSEASLDVSKGAAEERFSDGESGRRGKRLKTSTSKEAVSPASYPAVASNLKKCLELPTDVSKESGGYLSPGSSSRARGRSGHPLLSQATSSDPSTDPTQFRRSSDASNTVERSKVEATGVNCLGSRQGKPGSLHFPSSPLFGSSNHLPATSLFSPPGIPSLMHLLGPTFNPQFLGTGATVPPFPFLGFPSLLSMPGAGGASGGGSGGGGVQNVPPVIPAPPPVTNPWSSLLPPNTLMIPYPVLLPLPIPIPIPFPVPAKCGLQQQKGETAESSSKRQCDSGKADTFKERPGATSAGDLRGGLPPPAAPKGQDNRSESFPNHTIVCTCCRSGGDSLPGRRHSRSTFCSPCRTEGGGDGLANHQATSFADSPGSVPSAPLFSPASASAALASQNLAIDFSMARDSKSSSSLRSPSVQGASSYALTTPSSVSIKTEPLDLAISTENNNLSSSSPSSASSSLMLMKSSSSCEMHHSLPPSLPYLARRSLILDAPSISKERPVAVEKHFAADAASASSSSSKKFMYCKRRYPSLHIKTK